MQGILDNISKKSQDVVRKILYKNIKQAFHEADVQFKKLCNSFYADNIYPTSCNQAFKDFHGTLECIDHFLAKYIQLQTEVIGVDKDCDIKFIKSKIRKYKHKNFELRGGIKDRATHENYFPQNKTERQLIVSLYEEFLSLTNESDQMLTSLLNGYDKLYQTIHSSDSEQVLNRFNNHFKNVASHISDNSDRIGSLFKDVGGFSLVEGLTVKVQKDIYFPDLSDIGNNLFKFKFIELYDKPLELAQTIVEEQLDNSTVDNLFANVIISKYLYDAQRGVANLHHRARGRPPENFCYNDCIEAFGEMIKSTCPIIPRKEISRTERSLLSNWMVALFIAFDNLIGDGLYGKIASYYRLMEDIGFTPRSCLRHIQQKISDFRLYLREKRKGGFLNLLDGDFTKKWKSKVRRFAPLEELLDSITGKFLQLRSA